LTLCILAAGKLAAVAAAAFTLSWTHSVQKTEWREDWRVTPAGLQLAEARVRGSGAGMEPPEGSVLEDGWWVWRPELPPQRKLVLAASGATGGGWRFCAGAACRELGAAAGDPVEIRACQPGEAGEP